MKHFLARHATLRHRLYSLYYTLFSYGRGFVILFLCLWIGNYISSLIPIAIPGSIIGLLILFFLLAFQIIPTKWVRNGCNIFMRYMTLLFIPAAMGIMDNYVYLIHSWAPILISSIASTCLVMIFIGWLTQYMQNRSQKRHEHHQQVAK
ncbi:holin-like protein [Orbus hercynius]|uniref:Holin-like protein n=1 Tax=Orbus hercynius TaxID=593135 RepID=A0A495RJQ9_9GAMM|nr:CidA/LrgA family protein [Orbus hercynius]RKS87544.1 holin-like protein [Orbus hercynius]